MSSLRWSYLVLAMFAIVLLVSCSSDQKSANNPETVSASTTKSTPKMPQPITAAKALDKMQGFAQKQWAADAMPVNVESEPNSEANGQDGKATVWTATFGSMQRGEIRTFHWSGSLEANAPVSGVSAAPMQSAMTPDMASRMFQAFLLKTDTDQMAANAQKHGGEAILKKFPDQQMKYVVVFDSKSNAPVCYVIFGEDLKKNNGYGVFNAMSGNFLHGGKG